MTMNHEGALESTDEKSFLVKNPSGFLTVTGTIKRGKNKGEVFDVQLKMNRDFINEQPHSSWLYAEHPWPEVMTDHRVDSRSCTNA